MLVIVIAIIGFIITFGLIVTGIVLQEMKEHLNVLPFVGALIGIVTIGVCTTILILAKV